MIKKISFTVSMVLLAAMLIMTGCTSQNADTSSSPSVAATTDGNNSVAPATTAPDTATPAPVPVTIKTAGSTSVGPVMEALAEMYMEKYPNVTIEIEAGGSGVGVASCADGSVDFGMASRDLKQAEKDASPTMQATVLCLDGVAIVVNSANTVADLTPEQVKEIFEGTITNWSEVGGTDGKINLYTRDSASGTREAFQTLFGLEIDETKYAGIYDSNGSLATSVQGDPNGIGYMSLGIVANYNGVKALNIGGVEATTDNMSNGSYPYYRNFNLLTLDAPTGAVADLFNYCSTDADAIAYMTEKGYVMP